MKNKKSFSLYNKELHIVEKSKIWFAIPLVIILIALIEFFCFAGINNWDFEKGINVGIDFTGGTSMTVTLGEKYTDAKLDEVANEAEKFGVKVSYRQKTGTDTSSAVQIKYKNLHDDNEKNMVVNDQIKSKLEEIYGEGKVVYSLVGSTASSELLSKCFLAIFVTAICIFVYILFRFELWSGFTAVIALLHDLLIMFALTLIFRIEINASYIAALITILAYSINDTIVIFDRVREYIKLNTSQKIDYTQIVNKAITSSLTRSIYTSITTLLTIIVVTIMIPQIRDFALPIIFGIVAGTFSSIFLAAPMFVAIKKGLANSKRAKLAKAQAAAAGVEYVEESDYDIKRRYWNNLKAKFSSGANTKKSYTKVSKTTTDSIDTNVDSQNADTENVVATEAKKKPKQNTWQNPKKKKKNK